MAGFTITPVIRAHLDLLEMHGSVARVRGWIFRPDTAGESVDISLNGLPWVASLPLCERDDVRLHFEHTLGWRWSHPLRCGFDVTYELPPGCDLSQPVVLSVTVYDYASQSLGVWYTHDRQVTSDGVAEYDPPAHLQERVGSSRDFQSVGTQVASLIMTCVGKYKPVTAAHRILDWGCGCGRVIREMMKFVLPATLTGCDIDTEAIAWDKIHIRGPTFDRIDPYPPTAYSAGAFDLIYGISVMTHLDEQTQLSWLEELSRIASSGGIVALTIIGENLRKTNMPAELAKTFHETGFASFVPSYSGMLAPFSHQGYYQETYHSFDYIERTWRKFFDVLECFETKHQDILILRARQCLVPEQRRTQ
jgi:2-polyprenyl-3-methyl-5-hydroxy-6-metoxy-1,4-benzoquinol methylase